jgi:hypothetical protein
MRLLHPSQLRNYYNSVALSINLLRLVDHLVCMYLYQFQRLLSYDYLLTRRPLIVVLAAPRPAEFNIFVSALAELTMDPRVTL